MGMTAEANKTHNSFLKTRVKTMSQARMQQIIVHVWQQRLKTNRYTSWIDIDSTFADITAAR